MRQPVVFKESTTTLSLPYGGKNTKNIQPPLSRKIRIDRAIPAQMITNNTLHRMHAPAKRTCRSIYDMGTPCICRQKAPMQNSPARGLQMGTPQILRACIAGGYTSLFQSILATSSARIMPCSQMREPRAAHFANRPSKPVVQS